MDPDKIKYKLAPTEEGPYTVIITSGKRESPLHSRFYPTRESEIFADKFAPEKFDFLIVLGVGLGYHLLPLKEHISNYSCIILIDIVPGIEKEIAQNKLTSFLTDSETINLLTGKSSADVENYISNLIDMDRIKGVSVLEHPPSIRLFDEYYVEIKKSIEKIIDIKGGNKATREAFGSLYLKNILKNISCLDKFNPVSDFFKGFNSYPAVVITSGPSLEIYIDHIKTDQHKFFIISVDSALPVLYKNDIYPDFVISIDPQPYIYEHYQGIEISDAISIFSISAHPILLKKFKGLISLNSHPLAQLTSEIYQNSIGSIDSSTGNVAGDALNLCIKFGFRAVGIIGMDFSFPEYKIYSRGTAYQKRYSIFFHDRFSTVEGYNLNYIMKSSKGFKHSGKFTRRSFLQYKTSLENFIKINKSDNLYNINGYGIPIKGIPETSLEQFITDNCSSKINKKSIISNIKSGSKNIKTNNFIITLKNIIKEKIFDELLLASLGEEIMDRDKERYRKFIMMLKINETNRENMEYGKSNFSK